MSCANVEVSVVRETPSVSANARVDGRRAPRTSRPLTMPCRSTSYTWRCSGNALAGSSSIGNSIKFFQLTPRQAENNGQLAGAERNEPHGQTERSGRQGPSGRGEFDAVADLDSTSEAETNPS